MLIFPMDNKKTQMAYPDWPVNRCTLYHLHFIPKKCSHVKPRQDYFWGSQPLRALITFWLFLYFSFFLFALSPLLKRVYAPDPVTCLQLLASPFFWQVKHFCGPVQLLVG